MKRKCLRQFYLLVQHISSLLSFFYNSQSPHTQIHLFLIILCPDHFFLSSPCSAVVLLVRIPSHSFLPRLCAWWLFSRALCLFSRRKKITVAFFVACLMSKKGAGAGAGLGDMFRALRWSQKEKKTEQQQSNMHWIQCSSVTTPEQRLRWKHLISYVLEGASWQTGSPWHSVQRNGKSGKKVENLSKRANSLQAFLPLQRGT